MEKFAQSLPPLRSLLAFEAAARCGSFTSAARELNVSQPAISRQVQMLEAALGVSVFKREHRRVVLTKAGEIYYDAVVSGFSGMIEAGQGIQEATAPERVTIYANYGLATYWLMPRLSRYQQANPDVDIVVRTVEHDQPLSTSEPEIAIRFGDGNWHDGTAELLFRERGFPVCSPALVDPEKPIQTVEDLLQYRLLKVQSDNQRWLDWEGFFHRFNLKPPETRGPAFNNYTLAIQAALAGQGIAIGWDQIVDDYLKRGWLIRPIPEEVETGLGYYLVSNRYSGSDSGVQNVLHWLRSEAASSV